MVFVFNIQGLSTVSRAVINEVSSENRFELIIEGDGLKEVLGAQGVGLFFLTQTALIQQLIILLNASKLLESKLQGFMLYKYRQTIINEIIYTMSSHGMTIDRRHVMLLADLMSFKGEILGITRFGIAKMKDRYVSVV
jgi:DNA-directed RNA polymerase III subunit RPC1